MSIPSDASDEKNRIKGINLWHSGMEEGENCKYKIRLVESPGLCYEDVGDSECCEYQGFFY